MHVYIPIVLAAIGSVTAGSDDEASAAVSPKQIWDFFYDFEKASSQNAKFWLESGQNADIAIKVMEMKGRPEVRKYHSNTEDLMDLYYEFDKPEVETKRHTYMRLVSEELTTTGAQWGNWNEDSYFCGLCIGRHTIPNTPIHDARIVGCVAEITLNSDLLRGERYPKDLSNLQYAAARLPFFVRDEILNHYQRRYFLNCGNKLSDVDFDAFSFMLGVYAGMSDVEKLVYSNPTYTCDYSFGDEHHVSNIYLPPGTRCFTTKEIITIK